jgi:hypothetical protein
MDTDIEVRARVPTGAAYCLLCGCCSGCRDLGLRGAPAGLSPGPGSRCRIEGYRSIPLSLWVAGLRTGQAGRRAAKRCGSGWSAAGGVLFDEVADRDRFVAVGAQAAEVDPGAGAVAVVAPLLAQVAAVAGGAVVDGAVAAWRSGRDDDGSGGAVSRAPGRLPARGGAVALATGGGERGGAYRTRHGRLIVVTDVVTRRGCRLPLRCCGCRCRLAVVTDVVMWRGHRG